MATAENWIWLQESGGYIGNLVTGERMVVRVASDVYVFGVEVDVLSMPRALLLQDPTGPIEPSPEIRTA